MSCSPLVLVALLLVAGGLLLHAVGTATPAWSALEGKAGLDTDDFKGITNPDKYKINKRSLGDTLGKLLKGVSNLLWSKLGPWRSCNIVDACTAMTWGEDAGWEKAVQAMTVMGGLAAAGGTLLGLILFLLGCCQKSPNGCLVALASSISSLASLFMLAGVLIWGIKVHQDMNEVASRYVLGYSFYLSCVGTVLTGIGSMVYVCGGRQN